MQRRAEIGGECALKRPLSERSYEIEPQRGMPRVNVKVHILRSAVRVDEVAMQSSRRNVERRKLAMCIFVERSGAPEGRSTV
eukprot:5752833-Prymnesium_polylepis.2